MATRGRSFKRRDGTLGPYTLGVSPTQERDLQEGSRAALHRLLEQAARPAAAVNARLLRSPLTRRVAIDRRKYSLTPLPTKRAVGALPSGRGYANRLKSLALRPMTEVCVRRNERRQVLFALGVGGRGGKKGRTFKRNYWSQFKCR